MVRIADDHANQGKLTVSSVVEIAASLSFVLTESEAEFLARYIIWRVGHPNPK